MNARPPDNSLFSYHFFLLTLLHFQRACVQSSGFHPSQVLLDMTRAQWTRKAARSSISTFPNAWNLLTILFQWIYNFCSNISSNRQLINSQESPTNSLNNSMYQCNRQRLKVFSICQALPRDDKTSYSQENNSPTLEPYSATLQHLTLVSWFSLLRCHRVTSVLDTHLQKE